MKRGQFAIVAGLLLAAALLLDRTAAISASGRNFNARANWCAIAPVPRIPQRVRPRCFVCGRGWLRLQHESGEVWIIVLPRESEKTEDAV